MEFSSVSGIVSAIISVIFALILILPILMGAFRGLKKSAFRLLWVTVFGVLGFAFMTLISKAIVNIDITSFNIEVNGTIATTIPHFLELSISTANADMAQLVADNPEVFTMIVSLAISIINMFVFVIWYWLIKWLLWPVWAIISHFIFKNKVVKTSKVLKDGKVIGERQQVVKEKKYVWAGALIGLAMGIMSLMFTAIPLAGITDTLVRIEQATITEQEDGTQKGLLTANLGENAEAIYVYANSPAGVVLSAVGINQISTAMAKTVASTTTNGVTTYALDEIVNLAKLSNDAQTLSTIDFQALTQDDWTETLPKIQKITDSVLSSGVVKTCYDSLIPYVIDNMLNNPDYFIPLPDLGDDILNNALKDVLNQLKTITVDDINNDLQIVIDMVSDINNSEILTELVKGEVTLEYMQEKITVELGENLNGKLFDMKSVGKILPVCLEGAIEYCCSQLDVEYVASQTNLTAEQTKQFFDSLVTDYIIIFKNFDETQDIQIATHTFENLGDIVDSLKASGVVNTATFNNLVDYAVEELNVYIEDLNLKTSINTLVQNVLADIKYIPSFKNELKCLGQAVQVVLDEEIDIENLELKQATKVLDKVLTTFIYQYNIDDIEVCVADLINEYCTDSDISISQTTIQTICDNISNIYSFEQEFGKIENLVDYVEQMLEQGDFESQLKDTDTMSTLGGHLDTTVANNSILLSDKNCKLILQDIIKNVELPTELQGTTINGQDILVVMAENANDITSYQTEFVHISNILNIDGTMTLTEYGKALDSVKQSVLLNGVIEQVVSDKIIEKAELIDDAEIKEIVKTVANNISNNLSYEQEFGYLDQVVNTDFDTATLGIIGETLDSVKQSELLSGVIDDIIILQIERKTEDITDTDLIEIVEKVKANVDNITSYQTEFEYLQQFVDLDPENASMTEFGAMLDNFVDSKLFEGTTNDLLLYALDKGEAEIDDIYKDIYADVVDNVGNISGKVYEQELIYVQSFVDFTNNGELKTRANIEQYLNDNLLNTDGSSKSILLDTEITDQILALAV